MQELRCNNAGKKDLCVRAFGSSHTIGNLAEELQVGLLDTVLGA